MDRLATLTLGDIGRGLLRYRPVVVTVVTLLVLLALLPGPRFSRTTTAAASEGAVFGAGRRPPPSAASVADAAPAASSASPDTLSSTGSTSAPSFSSSPSPTFSAGPSSSFSDDTTGDSTFSGNEDAAAPDAQLAPSGPPGGGGPSTGSQVNARLAIVASAYASATAATPLGAQFVPPDTLPVGKRFGQEDKISYVRLAGQADRLELAEDPAGSRSTAGTIGIVACRVTVSNWSEGENKAFSEIPFDRNQCVPATRDDFFATWVFDLSAFPDRTDDKGFALVPAPDSSIDFQVAFKKS